MYSSISSSFFINRDYSCSSNPLVEIVDISGFNHCFEDMSYTMVGTSSCILFDSTNLSQGDGCLKYESREAFQDNEVLRSTPMVMLGTHYFGSSSRINKYIKKKILSLLEHKALMVHHTYPRFIWSRGQPTFGYNQSSD
jgi:hypothetical protein